MSCIITGTGETPGGTISARPTIRPINVLISGTWQSAPSYSATVANDGTWSLTLPTSTETDTPSFPYSIDVPWVITRTNGTFWSGTVPKVSTVTFPTLLSTYNWGQVEGDYTVGLLTVVNGTPGPSGSIGKTGLQGQPGIQGPPGPPGSAIYLKTTTGLNVTGVIILASGPNISITQSSQTFTVGLDPDITLNSATVANLTSTGTINAAAINVGGNPILTGVQVDSGTMLHGNVKFHGVGVTVSEDSTTNTITISGGTSSSSITVDGGSNPLIGTVNLISGTGISLVENTGASSITVNSTTTNPVGYTYIANQITLTAPTAVNITSPTLNVTGSSNFSSPVIATGYELAPALVDPTYTLSLLQTGGLGIGNYQYAVASYNSGYGITPLSSTTVITTTSGHQIVYVSDPIGDGFQHRLFRTQLGQTTPFYYVGDFIGGEFTDNAVDSQLITAWAANQYQTASGGPDYRTNVYTNYFTVTPTATGGILPGRGGSLDGHTNISGEYFYLYTFINTDGTETSPSPLIRTGSLAGGTTNSNALTHIQVGPTGTTGRNIYRGVGYYDFSGSQGYTNYPVRLLITLDNTVTTFTDDGSLTTTSQTVHFPLPSSVTPTITTDTVSTNIAAGTYNYVYTTADALNHVSVLSAPIPVTLSAPGRVNLTLPSFPGGVQYIGIWRGTVGTTGPYYHVGNFYYSSGYYYTQFYDDFSDTILVAQEKYSFSAPTTAPTLTLLPSLVDSTTSQLNSGKWYRYYLTENNGVGHSISIVSPFSMTTVPGNNAIQVTIPVSTTTGVVARSLYRNSATNGNLYKIATLDLTAQTYLDIQSDTTIQTGTPYQPYQLNINTSQGSIFLNTPLSSGQSTLSSPLILMGDIGTVPGQYSFNDAALINGVADSTIRTSTETRNNQVDFLYLNSDFGHSRRTGMHNLIIEENLNFYTEGPTDFEAGIYVTDYNWTDTINTGSRWSNTASIPFTFATGSATWNNITNVEQPPYVFIGGSGWSNGYSGDSITMTSNGNILSDTYLSIGLWSSGLSSYRQFNRYYGADISHVIDGSTGENLGTAAFLYDDGYNQGDPFASFANNQGNPNSFPGFTGRMIITPDPPYATQYRIYNAIFGAGQYINNYGANDLIHYQSYNYIRDSSNAITITNDDIFTVDYLGNMIFHSPTPRVPKVSTTIPDSSYPWGVSITNETTATLGNGQYYYTLTYENNTQNGGGGTTIQEGSGCTPFLVDTTTATNPVVHLAVAPPTAGNTTNTVNIYRTAIGGTSAGPFYWVGAFSGAQYNSSAFIDNKLDSALSTRTPPNGNVLTPYIQMGSQKIFVNGNGQIQIGDAGAGTNIFKSLALNGGLPNYGDFNLNIVAGENTTVVNDQATYTISGTDHFTTVHGAISSDANFLIGPGVFSGSAQGTLVGIVGKPANGSIPYSTILLRDKPVVWYRMGETSGSVMTDSSGHGHNGVYASGAHPIYLSAPTVAPTLSILAGTTALVAGTYTLGYSYVNPVGETVLGTTASIILSAGQSIGFSTPTTLPYTVTGLKWYMSTAASGTIAAGTYGVEITYVNATGETVASASGSIVTTTATSTITVPSPPTASGATGWYAYVTQAGGSTYTRQQAAGSPTAIGIAYTLVAPPTSTGAIAPTSNTTTIPAPAAPVPTTATTGGTVLAGTYGVEVTYINSLGETVASANGNIVTTGSTSTITIPSPVASGGATGWYAYLTQVGDSTYTRQQATPTAIGTGLTLTAPPTSTGLAPPTINTTTLSITPATPVPTTSAGSTTLAYVGTGTSGTFTAIPADITRTPLSSSTATLGAVFDGDSGQSSIDGSYATDAEIPVGTAPRSFEIWFKTSGEGQYNTLFEYGGRNYYDNGYLGFGIYDNGDGTYLEAQGLTIPAPGHYDNNWHHLVVTYDSSQHAIAYYDSVQVNSATIDLSASRHGSLIFGQSLITASVFAPWNWTGSLDEFSVYNYVLTATQVASHYQAAKGTIGNFQNVIDAQAGGISLFKIDKNGNLTVPGTITGANVLGTSAGVAGFEAIQGTTHQGQVTGNVQLIAGANVSLSTTPGVNGTITINAPGIGSGDVNIGGNLSVAGTSLFGSTSTFQNTVSVLTGGSSGVYIASNQGIDALAVDTIGYGRLFTINAGVGNYNGYVGRTGGEHQANMTFIGGLILRTHGPVGESVLYGINDYADNANILDIQSNQGSYLTLTTSDGGYGAGYLYTNGITVHLGAITATSFSGTSFSGSSLAIGGTTIDGSGNIAIPNNSTLSAQDINVSRRLYVNALPSTSVFTSGIMNIGSPNSYSNTHGSYLAIRQPTGETADAISAQKNGVEFFRVDSTGNVTFSGNLSAANFAGTTGAAGVTSLTGGTGSLINGSIQVTGTGGVTVTSALGSPSTLTIGLSQPNPVSNPMTTVGDIIYAGSVSGGVGVAARLAIGTPNQHLAVTSGGGALHYVDPVGFANPMSNAGDTIYGGAGGVATALASPGVAGYWKVTDTNGNPSWSVLFAKTKAGTPSDSDFTSTPPIGTLVVDTSANKIWARVGTNIWKSSSLT